VIGFSFASGGESAAPMTTGAVVRGVALNNNPSGVNGIVGVVEGGVATVTATNYGTSAAPAYLSTTTPSSVTTGGASDANTAVRVGIFLPNNQIYVRPTP